MAKKGGTCASGYKNSKKRHDKVTCRRKWDDLIQGDAGGMHSENEEGCSAQKGGGVKLRGGGEGYFDREGGSAEETSTT